MAHSLMTLAAGIAAAAAMVAQPSWSAETGVKNIVLVHGAWADGAGWKGVYDILTSRGYNVSIVQNPLTTFADEVAATDRVLARQDGPVVLVGHSHGGAVISEAGDDDKVVGLVYIAAFVPDIGELPVSLNPPRQRAVAVHGVGGRLPVSQQGRLPPCLCARRQGQRVPGSIASSVRACRCVGQTDRRGMENQAELVPALGQRPDHPAGPAAHDGQAGRLDRGGAAGRQPP